MSANLNADRRQPANHAVPAFTAPAAWRYVEVRSDHGEISALSRDRPQPG